MSAEAEFSPAGNLPRKRHRVNLLLIVAALLVAVIVFWFIWPEAGDSYPELAKLSRDDGKPRLFLISSLGEEVPPNLPLFQRVDWTRKHFLRHHTNETHTNSLFLVTLNSTTVIHEMLQHCMAINGTRYFVAVEIEDGCIMRYQETKRPTGTQGVAAVEHAIETNGPVVCYDFAAKTNFSDTLLLIREKPGVVKVIPRTKLADYQKAGLVKLPSP